MSGFGDSSHNRSREYDGFGGSLNSEDNGSGMKAYPGFSPGTAINTMGTGQVQTSASASDDEWYDQGFDLQDDSTDLGYYEANGINPERLLSAQDTLQESRVVSSDAADNLVTGNVQIHMDPLVAKNMEFLPSSTENGGPRTGPILVGGMGKISYVPSSDDNIDDSVYSDYYLAEKARKAAAEEEHYGFEEDVNDEFRTRIDRSNTGLSDEDHRFLLRQMNQQAREQQLQEQQKRNVGHNSRPARGSSDGDEARHVISVRQFQHAHVAGNDHDSVVNVSAEHSRIRRQMRIKYRQQQQSDLRLMRMHQLQEQKERLAQQNAARQARTDAAAARIAASDSGQMPGEAALVSDYMRSQAEAMLAAQPAPGAHQAGLGAATGAGAGYSAAQGAHSVNSAYIPVVPGEEGSDFDSQYDTDSEGFDAWTREHVVPQQHFQHSKTRDLSEFPDYADMPGMAVQSFNIKSYRNSEINGAAIARDNERTAAGSSGESGRFRESGGRHGVPHSYEETVTSFWTPTGSQFFAAPRGRSLNEVVSGHNKNTGNDAAQAEISDDMRYCESLDGSTIGDSALEQDAIMHEHAQTFNAFQQAQAEGRVDADGYEVAPSGQAPIAQNDDMSTASHRSRNIKEKSLEELAREYPGLSPEHLVKLKRSSNRCHLVSRTPVFDANSNITMYELKFTAGKVFQVNALKSDHVYHVLFGYFIRRGISCFIGRKKQVLVMMPITYDFLDYIDRYSVNRVVLRICPEQPVTPSALHILTKLRRSGMSFAIDLMLLLKREWNKAILSIEYVMIDLSGKVREQLAVFQRLKTKAPWLKTIGYNDTNGDGYAYLAKHMIDLMDGPYWNVGMQINQDIEAFAPMQEETLVLIRELFKMYPDYNVFQRFLKAHESLTRDLAVFLYRFRHASPRQVQNINELYRFLLDYSPNRCFSIIAGRAIMLQYVKSVNIQSQYILQEHYSQAIIRGYFCEYMAKTFNDPFVNKFGFQAGMFSLLHVFLLREEVDVISDDQFNDIFDCIYGNSELMADLIECVSAIESTNLTAIFEFIQKYRVPPASVLISYEKALMRTNELLLVLNIVTTRK